MPNKKNMSQKPSSKPVPKKKTEKAKPSETTEMTDKDLHEVSGGIAQPQRDGTW